MMIGVWKCLQDKAPSWWLLTLVIASILFMFFYRTKYLLPISCKAYEIIMGVLAVILWALLMILLLSVVGILPVTFTIVLAWKLGVLTPRGNAMCLRAFFNNITRVVI